MISKFVQNFISIRRQLFEKMFTNARNFSQVFSKIFEISQYLFRCFRLIFFRNSSKSKNFLSSEFWMGIPYSEFGFGNYWIKFSQHRLFPTFKLTIFLSSEFWMGIPYPEFGFGNYWIKFYQHRLFPTFKLTIFLSSEFG